MINLVIVECIFSLRVQTTVQAHCLSGVFYYFLAKCVLNVVFFTESKTKLCLFCRTSTVVPYWLNLARMPFTSSIFLKMHLLCLDIPIRIKWLNKSLKDTAVLFNEDNAVLAALLNSAAVKIFEVVTKPADSGVNAGQK